MTSKSKSGRASAKSPSRKRRAPETPKEPALPSFVGRFAEFCRLSAKRRKAIVDQFAAAESNQNTDMCCLNCPLTFSTTSAIFYHMERCTQLAKTHDLVNVEREYESSTRSSSSDPPSIVGSDTKIESNDALAVYMAIMDPLCTPAYMIDLYMTYKDSVGIFYELGDHRRRVLLRRLYESCARREGQSAEIPCFRIGVCLQAFTSPTCLLYHLQMCCAFNNLRAADVVDFGVLSDEGEGKYEPTAKRGGKRAQKLSPKKTPTRKRTRRPSLPTPSSSDEDDDDLNYDPSNIVDDQDMRG